MHWRGITNFLSPADWLAYAFMADVPTIHNFGMDAPGSRFIQLLFDLPPPSRWALIGLLLLVIGPAIRRSDEDKRFYNTRRGWIVLGAVLLVGGSVGPDDLGSAHGFLRERAVFLGFATFAPALRVSPGRALARMGFGLVVSAAIVQLGLFWDYGLKADRLVGEFMKAKPYVGTGKRVAGVMVNTGWHYRTSPIVHLPNMLGLDNENLVWNNYGPALDYFPIKYRRGEAKVLSLFIGNGMHFYDFKSAENKGAALNDYRAMMEQHHSEIDVLVMWSSTPELDEINRQWFEPQSLHESEHVKVLAHRAH